MAKITATLKDAETFLDKETGEIKIELLPADFVFNETLKDLTEAINRLSQIMGAK
jgi:hypothetical protein